MANSKYDTQVSREALLQLLTDAEVAKVSMAETASSLPKDAEYIDLEHLDRGVQSGKSAAGTSLGSIIPRSAVSAETWRKLTDRLGG